MANKINISELLKSCPTGMELDCTMIDNVVFEKIDFISSRHPIIIRRTDSNKTIHLTKYGQYSDEEDYKCVIFPKGKTTWEEFVPPYPFKDGDIITDSLGDSLSTCIFKGEGKIKGTVDYYCGISSGYFNVKDNECRPDGHYGYIVDYRLATEKEKEKLFQAIKENGYNWNPETKTLEKLVQPKFKIGDKVKNEDNYTVSIVRINDEYYNCVSKDGKCRIIYIYNQDDWGLDLEKLPKFKVGDRIKSKEYEYKHTITKVCEDYYELDDGTFLKFDCQDKCELVSTNFDFSKLVPFESKVLVRNDNEQRWIPAFWGGIREDGYVTTFGWSKYCVPYEGNEHLLDKTDDCDSFYKTWE